MKRIKDFFKKGFNTNTGYFYYGKIAYDSDNKPFVGYVICRGYRIFWLNGYDRIDVAVDEEDLKERIELIGKEVVWKQ